MKKEETVAARLPESLVSDIKKIESIEQTDRSTVVRRLLHKAVMDWKRDHAARLYADGSVSLERAAMDAGISVREMMEYIKQRKILGQYDIEDLEEDMTSIRKRSGKQ